MQDYNDWERERQEAKTARLRELEDMGMKQMWVADIQVGDIIVKTPDSLLGAGFPLMAVERIFKTDGSYVNEDEEFVPNHIVHWIGTCEDGITREFSYGHSHAVHVYREG